MDRHQSPYIPSSNLDFNGYYVRPTVLEISFPVFPYHSIPQVNYTPNFFPPMLHYFIYTRIYILIVESNMSLSHNFFYIYRIYWNVLSWFAKKSRVPIIQNFLPGSIWSVLVFDFKVLLTFLLFLYKVAAIQTFFNGWNVLRFHSSGLHHR